jgi:hypothetical protein
MPQTKAKNSLASARALLTNVIDFDSFLQRLGPKDRLNAERHLTACEAETEGGHAKIWRRMASVLMSLAPHASKLNGRQSLQFYIADGKYRMQVFAMEDLADGKVNIYCGDVREEATKTGLLTGKTKVVGDRTLTGIAGSTDSLDIESLSARSASVAPFYKDMLGWNRTAVRISLSVTASDAQITATEELCAISALKWADKEGKSAPAKSA